MRVLNDDPSGYRNAALRATWFSLAFSIVSAGLALFFMAGIAGTAEDAPIALWLALVGFGLFGFGITITRWLR